MSVLFFSFEAYGGLSVTDCLLTFTAEGQWPESYFASPTEENGSRPRFVMLIGAAGSGKSTWTSEARKQGWTVIANDEIRVEILTQMRREGKTVTPYRGEPELADPRNGKHFGALDRDYVDELVHERVLQALHARSPVVLDWLNHLPRLRVRHLIASRNAGYFTDALVFHSTQPDINLANIKERNRRGGVDAFAGRDEANLRAISKTASDIENNRIGIGRTNDPSEPGDYVDRVGNVNVLYWGSGFIRNQRQLPLPTAG